MNGAHVYGTISDSPHTVAINVAYLIPTHCVTSLLTSLSLSFLTLHARHRAYTTASPIVDSQWNNYVTSEV